MSLRGQAPDAATVDRVLRRCIEDHSGCWVWQGYTFQGYGQVGITGSKRTALTHHVTYAHFISEIPPGLELDHLCRNPSCCNPWHLEPVTHAVNVARSVPFGVQSRTKQARQHCLKAGHPYTPANTHIDPRGRRRCRTCLREWARAKKAAS